MRFHYSCADELRLCSPAQQGPTTTNPWQYPPLSFALGGWTCVSVLEIREKAVLQKVSLFSALNTFVATTWMPAFWSSFLCSCLYFQLSSQLYIHSVLGCCWCKPKLLCCCCFTFNIVYWWASYCEHCVISVSLNTKSVQCFLLCTISYYWPLSNNYPIWSLLLSNWDDLTVVRFLVDFALRDSLLSKDIQLDWAGPSAYIYPSYSIALNPSEIASWMNTHIINSSTMCSNWRVNI